MGRSFLVREWGAVSFVVTVLIGLILVPLALYFGNQGPSPVSAPPASPSAASSARSVSPASAPSPGTSQAGSASPSP